MSSPKFRFELSPLAQQDFIDILRHTGKEWGQDQLIVYRNKLKESFDVIRQHPQIGHQTDELPKTHRLYFVGSHVIVYRTLGPIISVVRILHQRMSLTKNYHERTSGIRTISVSD
jgi:toxin ParE1/3/4